MSTDATTDNFPDVRGAVENVLDEVTGVLLAAQRADGSWQDHLPSAAVSTAVAAVALDRSHRWLPELPDPIGAVRAATTWLVTNQDAAGGWGDAPGAAATLNATAVATASLELLGDDAAARAAATAGRAWVDAHGGAAALADRSRCSLGVIARNIAVLAGTAPVAAAPRLPVELLLLPRRIRGKLSFTTPGLAAFGLMHARSRRGGVLRRTLDRLAEPVAVGYLAELHRYQASNPPSLSSPAAGYQESPLMTGVVALGLSEAGVAGYATVGAAATAAHVVAGAKAFLSATQRPDGSWPVNRDLEFSAGMFVLHGLLDARPGRADHTHREAARRAGDWVLRSQRPHPFPATGAPGGGWGWSLPSGWPDTDDTCSALVSLHGLGVGERHPAVRAGVGWLLRLQNRDGSWSCFSRDAPLSMDASDAVFTAHACWALTTVAADPTVSAATTRALAWLQRVQSSDGSFGSLWYRERTCGTARVCHVLDRVGRGHDPVVARCAGWLRAHQNPDGGWGDGASASTPEETAWAVLALTRIDADAAERGVRWLLDHRDPRTGLWPPTLIGVYFWDLGYHDDLICAGYALQALGRWAFHQRAAR